MACPKRGGKKRKRLPSINPFFHFLKCMWKKYKGCKRSVVVSLAVKKWRCMPESQKEPYYAAACQAQKLHRKAKQCGAKPKCKPKAKKPKPKPCPPPEPQKKC